MHAGGTKLRICGAHVAYRQAVGRDGGSERRARCDKPDEQRLRLKIALRLFSIADRAGQLDRADPIRHPREGEAQPARTAGDQASRPALIDLREARLARAAKPVFSEASTCPAPSATTGGAAAAAVCTAASRLTIEAGAGSGRGRGRCRSRRVHGRDFLRLLGDVGHRRGSCVRLR